MMDYSTQLFDISEKLDTLIELISPFEEILDSISSSISSLNGIFSPITSSFQSFFDLIIPNDIQAFFSYRVYDFFISLFLFLFGFILLSSLFSRRHK